MTGAPHPPTPAPAAAPPSANPPRGALGGDSATGGTPTPGLGSMTVDDLLQGIASKTPAPGGGAVACVAGALAAATAGMVVAYSLGRASLAAHQRSLEEAAEYLERARRLFVRLADEDAGAYAWLTALRKLPPGDARRSAEEAAATAACVTTPMACVAASADLLRLCARLRGITNPHLGSDLRVAAHLGEAAARAGAENVRINLPMLAEHDRRGTTQELESLLARCASEARGVLV